MLIAFATCAQDSLVLVNGHRIAFTKMKEFPNRIEILTREGELREFSPDSILGISEPDKRKQFYLKLNPDEDDPYNYLFVQRLVSGTVSLYEKTKGADAIYLEKNNRFEMVFDPIERGEEKLARFEVFKSFFEDDMESMSYIESPSFVYKFKEIMVVLEHYNPRNLEVRIPRDEHVRGKIYLYRTKFQKTKSGLKIKYFDGAHDLYIEDFIQLEAPVNYPSQITVYDDFYKTDILISGDLEDQFYEVLYDKKSNGFILDSKKGTELYMEIVNIREKVDKRID